MIQDTYLELQNISKRFSGVQALKEVDFSILAGEIHCLVGENGSGKSTLIKIISGVHPPEPGARITIDGLQLQQLTPTESIRYGIQVIYQDHSLFPNLNVAENIAIGQHLEKGRVFTDWKTIHQTARSVMSKIGVRLDPELPVEHLSIADRQIVAICRAIASEARLVIMDEPTSSLASHEVEALLEVVRDLQQRKIATVFVSHRLNEVLEIAQRVTILRDGVKVGTFEASEIDDRRLAVLMTGKEIDYSGKVGAVPATNPVLEVNQLSRRGHYRDISFRLREGEILGLTGLLGSGRTELALSLFGLNPPDSGNVKIGGRPLGLKVNQEAIQAGIGYVPEDRLTQGLVLDQSISRNVIITTLQRFLNRYRFIDPLKKKGAVAKCIDDLKIKVHDPEVPVSTLSGGNQQRVVLAKWISTGPKVLILDSPTVGVDIAAKQGIYDIVKTLAGRGIGIIFISDEVPEVYHNCHRILVMHKGLLAGEYDPNEISETELSRNINEGKIY